MLSYNFSTSCHTNESNKFSLCCHRCFLMFIQILKGQTLIFHPAFSFQRGYGSGGHHFSLGASTYKTSLSAKPFMWKWLWFVWTWPLRGKTHFHMNGFELRLVLKQRQKRTRKWPIPWPTGERYYAGVCGKRVMIPPRTKSNFSGIPANALSTPSCPLIFPWRMAACRINWADHG